MSLQSRLFLFFTIIVVVPLAVAGFLAQRAVSSALAGRDRDRIGVATPGVVSTFGERIRSMPDAASTLAADPEFEQAFQHDPASLTSVLTRQLAKRPGRLDFAVVADGTGQIIATVLGQPAYLPGVVAPTAQELLVTGTGRDAMLPRASVMTARAILAVPSANPDVPTGTMVAGAYLDNTFSKSLAEATSVDVTIALAGRAVATSLPVPAGSSAPWMLPVTRVTSTPLELTIGGRRADALVRVLEPDVPVGTAALVTSTPLTSQAKIATIIAVILLVLGLAVVGAAIIGFAVSRAIARPLRELAAGADAIAAGHYDQHIEVPSTDEVRQLARAFNEMAARLSAHVAQLRESREELKRSLTRFGETLRSTHDLDKILQVVLDTSIDAVRASGGVLMVANNADADGPGGGRLPSHPGQLTVAAARGVEVAGLTIKRGEGIAGSVALTGEALRLPGEPGQAGLVTVPQTQAGEPAFSTGIWVPVLAQGRIFAVLSLFDREDRAAFTAGDLHTVLSLSDQAGVAIDNVVLHEEAQRLAITDGMTGIWNHRYFQLGFDQEVDRSTRFRRPFCLVLYDIDDFKVVNDTLGHLAGNTVLIELAQRVRSEIRDIDILARYGGEEFVLILPETDAEGGWAVAEKIRQAIAGAPFGADPSIAVTVSIGVSCFPKDGTDQTSLLRAADVALYEAKSRGKNRTIVYQSLPGQPAHDASPVRTVLAASDQAQGAPAPEAYPPGGPPA